MAGVSSSVTVGSSVSNGTNPLAMWAILEQMQLLILLLLTGAYIPEVVREYILGFEFSMGSSSYLPFNGIPIFGNIIEFFDEEQEDANLDDAEIFSKSAFVVNATVFGLVLLLICFHMLMKLYIKKCITSINEEKWINWFIVKLDDYMTYGIYIRIMFELDPIFLLSSSVEIYAFETHSAARVISLILAFMIYMG